MSAQATLKWSSCVLQRARDGWTAKRIWQVVGASDELTAMTATAINGSPAIPAIGESHPANPGLRCNNLEASCSNGPTLWEVTASYILKASNQDGETTNMRLLWRTVTVQEQIDRDVDNNPILNSAKDAPSTPPVSDFNYRELLVTVTQPFYNVAVADEFENTINDADVTAAGVSCPKETLRLVSMQPANEYYLNDSTPLDIQFLFRRVLTGHQLRFPDMGRRAWYSKAGTNTFGEIFQADGTQISNDIRLNGKGKPMDATLRVGGKSNSQGNGVEIWDNPTGAEVEALTDATFLKYKRYKLKDFTQLGL